MSLVDDIRSELTAMRHAVGHAQTTAGEAHHGAGQIAGRANAWGFRGIAGRLFDAQRTIADIRSGLTAADDRLTHAHAGLEPASVHGSPQQLIDTLNPVHAAIGAVRAILAETSSQASSVQRLVAATLDGGQPGPMLALLTSIDTAITDTLSRCDAAERQVTATLSQARQAGELGGHGTGPHRPTGNQAHDDDRRTDQSLPANAPAGENDRDASPPPAGTEPQFTRTQPIPVAVEEIRPHVGRDVAAGRLYDTAGRPLTPLVGPGDTRAATGLTPAYQSLRFVTHVESAATAHMRRDGVREAVLYLNMRPCTGEDGCQQNLEATLPPRYRLTVYQVRPNGSVRVWYFRGTGEGLADE